MVSKVSLGQEDKKDLKVKKGIALDAFWVRNSEGALLAPVALLAFQEPLASLEGKENLVIKDHMVFLASLEQKDIRVQLDFLDGKEKRETLYT